MKKNFTQICTCLNPSTKKNKLKYLIKILTSSINLNFKFLIVIYLFLTGIAESNWILPEKKNSIVADRPVTSGPEKKDSLPEGVTQDWLNSLRDENGNRIIPESDPETSRQIPEDPEGDAMQRKIFNGLVSGDRFGWSVSSAGDVNGDVYDDIIVGAYVNNGNTGRAYVFYGGLNMNTVADVTLTGETINNNFGKSVSSAGDVNGDGYSDVIVGAYGYSASTGRAYIYFGGASMNNVADVIMTGEAVSNNFGFSVSSAGDVNGDGYSDVVTGAYGYSASTGRAYIYFGGASMNNVADILLTGEAANNYFGISVSSAGDVNSDGFSDVITSAYGYSSSTGRAYIYYGGASMNNIADILLTGEATNNYFGISVSSAGDVNGDGYSDVIAGAYGYSSSTGRAYIYYGGASMNNAADITITGEATNNFLGISVSSAGDVNGDGYSDVIAGAYGYSTSTGRAYIYFGGVSMNNAADVTMTGEATGNSFGISVSSAGDVNGDGYPDVLVGAFGYSGSTGRVYLYDYQMRNEIIQDVAMTGQGGNFGFSVSSAGDVNGDGYSDVIIGAYQLISYTGRSYIYFGGASMDNIADVTMTGEAIGVYFGNSVSSAGDVNGDGYSDVIVGAIGYSSFTGKAYIYFGGASMNNIADVTMTGETGNDFFGNSVSSAGDVNGDGYSDVIVGASFYSSYTGRAYIYFGGGSMNNVADVTMTGEAAGNNFGFSVSTAGDVNGDGYSDVVTGAYGYSGGTGRAYIYFGGALMDNIADVTMTGEATLYYFGNSVSSAGDVNGDGFPDVIIGAYGYSTNTGKAYIYFGGASMNNVADVTMTGETTNNNFGISVSSAGDVNGDGYSDVIVGANQYSSFTGRAYIYFGGTIMNNVSDVLMTGETINDGLGISVSSAGDINGDGYSDLIIGADNYSAGTGRAYVYYGSAISAKPILNYVKDVPNDQGGKVNLKWARSGYDVRGINKITDYIVYRSYPPSGGGFSWEQKAIISASNRSFYTYTDNTPSDSSTNGTGTMFYQIMARTGNNSEYWVSNILSGRSLDNIAPLMVSPFTAVSSAPNVRTNWKRSSAPDLMNYILFKSTSPSIDPYTETPFATTIDSTYLDTSPLSGVYYYFIVAQDIHGNYSPVAVTENPNITLNLTMFIEGFYNAGSNSQVSDTILVELRNSTSPFALADQSSKIVSANGTVQLKFGNAPGGNYYIAVKHRNSIETWSSGAIALSRTTPASFDLSSSLTQAFGSNLIQADASPVRYAIFSGDINQDGTVDASDLSETDNDAFSSLSGYVRTDVTGDDFVDAADVSIVDNNAFNSVSAVTP